MLEALIAKVFATRNAAHLAHWAESSGYRHETLAEFCSDVTSALDTVVEAYQGRFGKIGTVVIDATVTPGDILRMIADDCNWIEKNEEVIAGGSAAVCNKIQELTAVYLKTIYKLENLK